MTNPAIWVPALATVIVAIIGVYTARLAQRGASAQRYVDDRTKLIDSYAKADERRAAELKELGDSNKELRDRVRDLEARQKEIEAGRAQDRAAIDLLTEYCRRLLILLHENAIDVPPPPMGLSGYGWPDSPEG